MDQFFLNTAIVVQWQVIKCGKLRPFDEYVRTIVDPLESKMIRTVTQNDATTIAEIYNHYVLTTSISFELEPVSPADISGRISEVLGASLPWLVIENEGQVRGYTYATKWRSRPAYRQTLETTVYVSKDQRGQGFGRAVYSRLLADLAVAGFHTAIGVIALPNEASVRLHESLGFKKAAHFLEVGYKFGKWIDSGFWQLLL